MTNKYKNYLLDLGLLLKENATEAKQQQSTNKREFDEGYLLAYYEVITLMQQQADAFEIPLNELQLDHFDADQELM